MTGPGLHPVLEAAAAGQLPAWSEAGGSRREHMDRVASLMDEWATGLSLPRRDLDRWVAAARLHDALRDAPGERLRSLVPPEERDLPDFLLHGPAAAHHLRAEGVDDEPLLLAVGYHTTGHPGFDRLGRCLYGADFLEPGRGGESEWRARLRARMPGDEERVIREVVRARILRCLERELPLRGETAAFWSSLVRQELPEEGGGG